MVLSILWGGFIFSNSLKPGVVSDQMSNPIVDRLAELLSDLGMSLDVHTVTVFVRKGAHFGEFFLLGLLISLIFVFMKKGLKHYSGYILFLCLLSGVTDEFIQFFVEGRSSQVTDVVLDFSGCLCAFLLVSLIYVVKHRKKTSYQSYRFRT